MRINECKSGLLRRYHPDKCKSNIFDRINALSLFKLPDHELYNAVINYYGPSLEDLRSEVELSYQEAQKAGAIERVAQQKMLDEEEKKRKEDMKQNYERIEKHIAESHAQLEAQLQESRDEMMSSFEYKLSTQKAEVKAEVKAELQAEMQAMQAEVQAEMRAMQAEVQAEMNAEMENFMQRLMVQQQSKASLSSDNKPMDAGKSGSFFKPATELKSETQVSTNSDRLLFDC